MLFLGDNGHHKPSERAADLLPALARAGIDMAYSDDLNDLNTEELDPLTARALDEHLEPVSSITEQTTRTFEPSYGKGERR